MAPFVPSTSAGRRTSLQGAEKGAGKAARGSAYSPAPGARSLVKAAPEQQELSPRLFKVEPNATMGAPLLPPPRPKSRDDSNGNEDRFCTSGPTLEGVGGQKSVSSQAEELTFADLVVRLEAIMGQASLLISDRIQTLQRRSRGAKLTAAQVTELCEIADGISAATYHAAKWAYVLQPKGETALSKPKKPSRCTDMEEASASLRYLIAKLAVTAAAAGKALADAVKTHGDEAEKKVRKMGVPIEDLQSLAPHLEWLIMRLGRLAGNVKQGLLP